MYSDFDPDKLVPKAIATRDEMRIRELKVAEQQHSEELRRRAADEQAELERQRRKTAEVQAFRKNIKSETSTNCGPVLELKTTLVKVYFPVAGYGSEHWINKEQLFPPSYGCRFVNGVYLPPPR